MNLNKWEEIPDEDLWEDGELDSEQVKEKIYDVYGVPIYSLNPFWNFGLEGHKYESF